VVDHPGRGDGEAEPSLSVIMSERRRLLNIAYRLLGSLVEAEDVLQEAYARWYAMSPEQRNGIESPGAWLATVTSRICFDILGSARVKRERYVGPWIPEPLPDRSDWVSSRAGDSSIDPADRVTLDESVNMAFLVVLESLTPAQRVVFILHDVFRYSFNEVAEIVGRTPAACRQLASAARRRIRESSPSTTPRARRAEIVKDFKRAWEARDVEALVGLLDPQVIAIGDGGGLASAVLHPIHGSAAVAQFFVQIAAGAVSATVEERTVNGEPGLFARPDAATVSVIAFDISGDRIRRIWAVRNPEKLGPWGL
jgi:RNA polymerase sigma-70 factor, ECF subfamily